MNVYVYMSYWNVDLTSIDLFEVSKLGVLFVDKLLINHLDFSRNSGVQWPCRGLCFICFFYVNQTAVSCVQPTFRCQNRLAKNKMIELMHKSKTYNKWYELYKMTVHLKNMRNDYIKHWYKVNHFPLTSLLYRL